MAVFCKITSDFRYSANFLEVYSPPPSVRNRFTCLPDFFPLSALHCFNFSRASHRYFNMYSSIWLVALVMKCSIYRPPLMAVCRGQHMSECNSHRESVARDVVLRVKGFRATLHLMRSPQSYIVVILGPSIILSMIPKALRLTCAKRRRHNIRFSASSRDACPVIIRASGLLL